MIKWPINLPVCNNKSSTLRLWIWVPTAFLLSQVSAIIRAVPSRSRLNLCQNKKLAFLNSPGFLPASQASVTSLSFSKTGAVEVSAALTAILEVVILSSPASFSCSRTEAYPSDPPLWIRCIGAPAWEHWESCDSKYIGTLFIIRLKIPFNELNSKITSTILSFVFENNSKVWKCGQSASVFRPIECPKWHGKTKRW